MKFAKRLEAEAIIEWRPKYLDYHLLKQLARKIPPASTSPFFEKTAATAPKVVVYSTAGGRQATHVKPQSKPAPVNAEPPSSEEKVFLERVQVELAKVEEFYKAREQEAVDRRFQIMAQLQILPGKDKAASHESTWRSWGDRPSAGAGAEGAAASVSPAPSTKANVPLDDEQAKHLKITSLRTTSYSNLARLRIKKALREFYRSLELLRSYRTLNATGFSKIMKKHEKIVQRGGLVAFQERLRGYAFAESRMLESLLSDAENIYRWVFTDGDRQKALSRLRCPDMQARTFHGSAFSGGVLAGVSVVLVLMLFAMCHGMRDKARLTLAYVYGGMYLPVLMMGLFACNMVVWERFHINYRFIFEYNPRTMLHPQQYVVVVGLLSLSFLCYVIASLSGRLDMLMRPFVQPWGLLASLLAGLLLPPPFPYWPARFWLLKVLLRIFTAPFYPVRFKDFFVSDQFMSLGFSFQCVGWLIWLTRQSEDQLRAVGVEPVWYVLVLALVPATGRTLQCVRRYVDTGMRFPHIANLAKYLCSFSVPIVAYVSTFRSLGFFRYIQVVLLCVATVYSLLWDVVMDFGLYQAGSVHPLLRDTLLFRVPAVYYALVVFDLVARLTWTLSFILPHAVPLLVGPVGRFPSLHLSFVLAIVEVVRRFVWNFFRVEFEQINNCNSMRAVADVPLPFRVKDLFYHDMAVEAVNADIDVSVSRDEEPYESDGGDEPVLPGEQVAITVDVKEEVPQRFVSTSVVEMLEERGGVSKSAVREEELVKSGWSTRSRPSTPL